jgi:uncharacterized protein YkwD
MIFTGASMNKLIRFVPFVIFLLILTACSQVEDASPDPTSRPTTKGIADVESIEILNLADQPDQVRVAAHFLLPDQCTTIDNVDVQQSGNAFRITVTTIGDGNTTCPDQAVEIERLIPLSESGLPPGAYTVVVNDSSSRFELAAEATPIPALQETPETPEPAAEETGPPAEPETGADSSAQPEAVSSEGEGGEESPAGPEEDTGDSEVVVDQPACEEKVGFFGDVTVPDDTFFRKGETFTKVWKLRNEGTCSWDSGYALVFAGGHILNAPLTIPLPIQVAPGEIFDLSLDMAAPFQGGTYVSKWLFQNPQGEQFGMGASRRDVIYTRIAVGWISPGETSEEGNVEGAESAQPSGDRCAVELDLEVEQEIFNLINSERLSRGLRRLALEDRLTAAARNHSEDMACNNFTDHTGSDGSTWRTRVDREGYTPSFVAENIYYGGMAQDAFDWWMNSQIHKDNILNANATEIGIGFANYSQSRWVRYYTLVFGRP